MNLFPGSVLLIALLCGCAGPSEPLVVKQFQLRDQLTDVGDDPMVRSEKLRRLHGAVTMEERRGRLGQYYTLLWSDPTGAGQGDVEVRFEFQQGASGSRIKRMERRFPSPDPSGRAEFAVIGDDYFGNGRVLAWKASLMRGGRILSTQQSYLWQ